jgi:hypothetical protein
MAFFLLPALLWSAAHVARRLRSVRPIVTCAALGLCALLVYVYLPVRAAQQPPANFGTPITLQRMYWVVSGRVYAREMGAENPQPLAERFADMGVALVENLQLWVVLAAAAGVYCAWRAPSGRRVGALWLLVAATVLGLRPWLGPVRANPDSLGYLIAGIAALGVLAALCVAAAATALAARAPRTTAVLLCACVVLAASGQLWWQGRDADLFAFHATDSFDEYRLRDLPQRGVLIATTPQSVFRFLELAACEALRPDAVLIPLPFLRYPGVAAAVIKRHPQTRELVHDFLALDRLRAAPLMRLSGRRPVMTELESHVAAESYRSLLPAGLLYAVVRPRAVRDALPRATRLQRVVHARLADDLGAQRLEIETSRQLLWIRYTDALYYAALGRFDRAREALAEAARLRPSDAHVRSLEAALRGPEAPLDVQPFFRFVAP